MPCACSTLDLSTTHESEALQESFQSADPFTNSYAIPHYQPRLPLRPAHLDLNLTFDIPGKTVHGTAMHTLIAQWDGAHTITLNAEDFSELTARSSDDDHLEYSYDGHVVQVSFSKELKKGQSVDLQIVYKNVKPIDGLIFSSPDDGFFAVSDHETERARYWLPVVDHPVVRTTISFTLSTPAEQELTVLANGEFISEEVLEAVKVTKWDMKQITPSYLICVAIGKFIVADDGEHKGKKIRYFAPIGGRNLYTVEDLHLTFGRTKEMIEFMEDKIKFDLPWPKYYQWACGEVGGAMENSSLVSYDEWYMLDERSASERSFRVDSTVVHELAHSWFGDTVVCSDFCHSFLKESFATLISAEWYHHKYGNDDFQLTLTRYADVSFAETCEYVRPIVTRKYETSWSVFDRHLYTNGAWRLHMLRVKLGDTVFWNAVSGYLHKRAWTAVETDDFRRDMEEYSGEQLCSFFEQWFYGRGHPILEGSFSYDGSRGGCARVSIKQTQMDERKRVGTFDIAVEIAMEVRLGCWETETIVMEGGVSSGQMVVKVDTKPLQVIIDPEMKVLHKLTKLSGVGDDMWMRSLMHAGTFAGRCQAARMLHEGGSKRGRRALMDGLEKEKNWGLRGMIAGLLAKTGRKEMLHALIDGLGSEKDARVVPTIVTGIGEFRDEEAERALVKFVEEGREMGRGYGAIGAALKGVGRQRKMEHLELLRAHLEDGEWRGMGVEIGMGAASGLGQLGDWRAFEVLERNVRAGRVKIAGRVRGGIVRGIGQMVVWEGVRERRKGFEVLEGVCKNDGEVKSVRLAAGGVMAGLGDAGDGMEALDELEKCVENQSKGTVRGMKRRMKRTANGREGGMKGSGLAVEKLEMEMRELKMRMEELGRDK